MIVLWVGKTECSRYNGRERVDHATVANDRDPAATREYSPRAVPVVERVTGLTNAADEADRLLPALEVYPSTTVATLATRAIHTDHP